MIASRLMATTVFALSCAIATAQDNDPRFDSADPTKAPVSVPLSGLERRINDDPAAEGIKMSVVADGRVLRLDILSMPGSTSMAATERVIFMIARVARADYDEMRFSDEGVDLFVIDGNAVRAIGRQFVWGEEGKGQNPIHLLRLFVDALRLPDGTRAAPPFPGSLLGDTNATMNFLTKVFSPAWVLRHTVIQ